MRGLQLMPTRVLQVMRFVCRQIHGADKRRVRDYEIDFYLSGKRHLTVDGASFAVSDGSVVVKRPGQYAESEGDYDAYVLTLNFCPNLQISPSTYRRDRHAPDQPSVSHPLIDGLPTHFHAHRKQELVRIFEQLCLCSYPAVENPEKQQILLHELFLLLNAEVFHEALKPFQQHDTVIQNSCRYIHEHFDKELSLSFLAEKANLSPNYFLRLFKKEIGVTPKEYILQVRLEQAKSLLSGTSLKISAVATACGFHDASYFSLFFKKRFGMTPLEHRMNK